MSPNTTPMQAIAAQGLRWWCSKKGLRWWSAREAEIGISNSDEASRCCMCQPHRRMEVDLVMRRELVGGSNMQQLSRAAALRDVGSIFDKGVPRYAQLPIEEHRQLARVVTGPVLGRPVGRELPRYGPVGRERARPGQLQPRVIAAARYATRSGREGQKRSQRQIEACEGG